MLPNVSSNKLTKKTTTSRTASSIEAKCPNIFYIMLDIVFID